MSAARERVVVDFDGSAESLAALRWAIGEPRHRQADVDVITCWYPPLVAEASGYQVGFVTDDELSAGARLALAAALASVQVDIQDATAEGRSFAGRLVEGAPGPTLVSESTGATVIVVGRRGRGALSRLLLGSVSRHVADHAECPVVVVPASAAQ